MQPAGAPRGDAHQPADTEKIVAASTQNHGLNALVFVHKQVLGREDLALESTAPAKRPERLPSAFHRAEIERCAGDRAAARSWARRALALDPAFSVRWAPAARRLAA